MEDGKEKCESIKTYEELMQKGQRKETERRKSRGRDKEERRRREGNDKSSWKSNGP